METVDEQFGRVWAETEIMRIRNHRQKMKNGAVGTLRHLIYCAWVGFQGPVLYTAVGRSYSKTMKEATK